METKGCEGTHRFFIAERAAVEETGKICIFIVCTACGLALMRDFKVSDGPTHISLGSDFQEN